MVDSRATTGRPLDKASEISAETFTKAFEFVGRRWLVRLVSLLTATEEEDGDDAIFQELYVKLKQLRCALSFFYGALQLIRGVLLVPVTGLNLIIP